MWLQVPRDWSFADFVWFIELRFFSPKIVRELSVSTRACLYNLTCAHAVWNDFETHQSPNAAVEVYVVNIGECKTKVSVLAVDTADRKRS